MGFLMTQCATTRFDLRGVDCLTRCRMLLDAYYARIAGNQAIEVRFNERWITYRHGDVDALIEAYRIERGACPAAAAAGLPDLNPGQRSRRGRPASAVFTFPRL
jgi:hypothetical protein